jgi:hypothetical protein
LLGPLREKTLINGIFVQVSRQIKMPCKRVSLHRDPVGEPRWSSFAGTFDRKEKVYLGSFLGPKGH